MLTARATTIILRPLDPELAGSAFVGTAAATATVPAAIPLSQTPGSGPRARSWSTREADPSAIRRPGSGGSDDFSDYADPNIPVTDRDPVTQTIYLTANGTTWPCWLSSDAVFSALEAWGFETTHLNRLTWPLGCSETACVDVVVTGTENGELPSGDDVTLYMGTYGSPKPFQDMTVVSAKPLFSLSASQTGDKRVAYMIRLADLRYHYRGQDPAYYGNGDSPYRGVPYGLRNNADADTEIPTVPSLDHYWQGTWEQARPAPPREYGAGTLIADPLPWPDRRPFNWIAPGTLGEAIDAWCMNTGMVYGVRTDGVDFFDRIGGYGSENWHYTWENLIASVDLKPYLIASTNVGGDAFPINCHVYFSRGYSNNFIADINRGDYASDVYASTQLHQLVDHLGDLPGELEPVVIVDRAFEIKDEDGATSNASALETRADEIAELFSYRYRVGNSCGLWSGIQPIEPCGCTQKITWGFSRHGVPFTRVENSVRWWGYGMANVDDPPYSPTMHAHGRIRAAYGLDGSALLTTAPPSVQLGTITNVNATDPTSIKYNAVSREDSTLQVTGVESQISVTDGLFNMDATAAQGTPCLILMPAQDGDTSLTLWVGEHIDSRECP